MATMRTFVSIAICCALLLVASLALAEVRKPHAIAVIIGNKDYTNTRVPDVAFADRDAAAVKRFAVETLGYDPANIVDLPDATGASLAWQ